MKLVDILTINEAMYAGNLGAMEMFKFQKVATTEQKEKMKQLLAQKKNREVWTLIQKVTGMKLKSLM